MKKNSNPQDAEQMHVTDDNNFVGGEAYPNCEGEPCANVADDNGTTQSEPAKMTDNEKKRSSEAKQADEVKKSDDSKGAEKTKAVDEKNEKAKADEMKKTAEEAAHWRERYIRLQAEFDNYRKRTLKEKIALISSAGEDVIKAMLPVVDDMDRALEAMQASKDAEAVKQGIVLISNKLRDTLRGRGVTEIEAMGQPMDTDYHEAISKIPADKNDRGKIVAVVQKGYKLNDKVIRHSKVVVGE